jgi:ketosteroid isomerase-like protein
MPWTPRRSLNRIASLFLCALICATAPTSAQQDKLYTASRQQLEAVKIVLAQEAAWNRGDIDAFLSRFKDDPETQIMMGNSVRGLINIHATFRLNYPTREAMGTIGYSDVEARDLGENFAMATGKYHLERAKKAGGSVEGTFTEVMEKTPDGWMVIFSETT